MKTKEEIIKFLKEPKPESFNEISEELLRHLVILKKEQKLNEVKKDVKYNISEIEFYYYGEGHQDRHTYIRNTNAGSWFFHGSGVDLAFQTIEDKEKGTLTSFGGILIRSIIKTGDKVNEEISGPIRCMEELINNNVGVLEWDMVEESLNKDKEVARNQRTGLTPFKAEKENQQEDFTKKTYKYYLEEKPWQKINKRYKYLPRQKDKKMYITIKMAEDKIEYNVE